MRLIWSPTSQYDRSRIFQHVAIDNLDAAEQLDQLFERSAEGLLEFPKRGRAGRKLGTREFVAHPNYIIIYRVGANSVEIARVLHAAQRWP